MQSKKLTHGYQKTHSKERMAKYDPENAQAWAVIMNKIRQEYATGSTQLSIAKRLGVTKVAVSRWLSEDRGGERTTFGDMLRYAKALEISYDELIGKPQQTTTATPFDKATGTVLKEFARDNELTLTEIARQANMSISEVDAILTGTTSITAGKLHQLCKAIEIKATIVLNRAENLLEKEQK